MHIHMSVLFNTDIATLLFLSFVIFVFVLTLQMYANKTIRWIEKPDFNII